MTAHPRGTSSSGALCSLRAALVVGVLADLCGAYSVVFYNIKPSANKVCFYHRPVNVGGWTVVGPLAYKDTVYQSMEESSMDLFMKETTSPDSDCPVATLEWIASKTSVSLDSAAVNGVGLAPGPNGEAKAKVWDWASNFPDFDQPLSGASAALILTNNAQDVGTCQLSVSSEVMVWQLAPDSHAGVALTHCLVQDYSATFDCASIGQTVQFSSDLGTQICGATSTQLSLIGRHNDSEFPLEAFVFMGDSSCGSTCTTSTTSTTTITVTISTAFAAGGGNETTSTVTTLAQPQPAMSRAWVGRPGAALLLATLPPLLEALALLESLHGG